MLLLPPWADLHKENGKILDRIRNRQIFQNLDSSNKNLRLVSLFDFEGSFADFGQGAQ